MKIARVERILEHAFGRRGSRYGNLRLRSVPYPDVLAAYGILATVVLVSLCIFIAQPVEPFGYWRDLGFAHETAAGAVFTIHSWTDAFDALAWTPWYNSPLFFLNSNFSEAVIAVVTRICGNAWLAVKIVQVLEVILAAFAAFAMYRTYSTSRFWGMAFGFSYAAVPAVTLAIRGNPAFGWVAVLAPAAIAAGTLLIRTFGARALALVGFVCGAAGYGIGLEFAAFSSLPLFALIIAGERRRLSLQAWLTFVPLGLLCCAASGAFFVLPTFSAPIFSDSASRTDSLVTGSFLVNFSETWNGLLTLVPREAYVSPFPDYNAASALPGLFIFGALVWAGALGNVSWNRKRLSGWADSVSVSIVAICVVLAMGTAIPFGQKLWDALFLIPHLDAIRTTDRFLLVPSIMVPFWYVCALERAARTLPFGRRLAGWLSVLVIVAFISFDISQHCFALEPTKGSRQPEIDEVQRVVLAEGGKTASFAGVNGAFSFEDSSEYGVPEPITPAAQDLGWRFLEDGDGAIGLLGRMGVRTVVSAPNWTGAVGFPNTANIFRRLASAPLIFKSPEDVFVSRLTSRPDVSSQTGLCVFGGPGGFDLLDTSAQLQGTTFLEPRNDCRHTGYVNFDIRDRWMQPTTLEAWAGSALFPAGRKVHDIDYPFVPNRVLLNIPWYRNSVDGDRTVFSPSGAIEVGSTMDVALPSTREWPPGTTIAIRLCSHVTGALSILDSRNATVADVPVISANGFRWYEVHMIGPKKAFERVTLHLQPDPQFTDSGFHGFALDGVAISKTILQITPPDARAEFVAVSLDRFQHRSKSAGPSIVFAPYGGDAANAITTRMHVADLGGTPAWLADGAISQVRFPWTGATGVYEIRVRAILTKFGETAGLDANPVGTCCKVTASNEAGFSGLEGRFRLQKGSQIVVRLVSPAFDVQDASRIMGVDLLPVRSFELPLESRDGDSGIIDFNQAFEARSQIAVARQIQMEPPLAQGVAGSELVATSILVGHPKSVAVEILKTGVGDAAATLTCDGLSTRDTPLLNDDTTLAVSGQGINRCSIVIHWASDNLGIRFIKMITGGISTPGGTTNLWIPGGRYRASILQADGSVVRRFRLQAAGCVGQEPICDFHISGEHRIALGETSPSRGLLTFMRLNPVPASPPIEVKQTAALRWAVALKKTTDVVLTQMNDGNWILVDGPHQYGGERCDIVDTCFIKVPSGRYQLYHRWALPLRQGLAITLTALVIAFAFVLLGPGQRRTAV